jgi:hypothetical protein
MRSIQITKIESGYLVTEILPFNVKAQPSIGQIAKQFAFSTFTELLNWIGNNLK